MIGTLLCLLCLFVFALPQPPVIEALGYLGGGGLERGYQLLTYVFCHASFSHLGFNLLMLVPSCWYLEQEIGWKRTGILCMLSAAAGALLWDYAVTKSAFYVLVAGQPRILIGASAVASGTVCAGLLVLGQRYRHLAGAAYLMLVLIFTANLSEALAAQAAPVPVAYWGHVAGYLVGLFMAPSLCQPRSIALSRRRR